MKLVEFSIRVNLSPGAGDSRLPGADLRGINRLEPVTKPVFYKQPKLDSSVKRSGEIWPPLGVPMTRRAAKQQRRLGLGTNGGFLR